MRAPGLEEEAPEFAPLRVEHAEVKGDAQECLDCAYSVILMRLGYVLRSSLQGVEGAPVVLAWSVDRAHDALVTGLEFFRVHARNEVQRRQRVVAGGVAAPLAVQEFVDAIEAHWGFSPEMLTTTVEARGVRNAYSRPELLGVDRWAAMVAAFVRFGGPVLIADCGTALTVDCVDAGGGHLGGWIVPGLGLLRQALARGTRLESLALSTALASEKTFGCNTEEAVILGCLNTLAGTLERARRGGSLACGAGCRLLLTGGDAEIVYDRLSSDWKVVPGLVLDGLALLAGEGQ